MRAQPTPRSIASVALPAASGESAPPMAQGVCSHQPRGARSPFFLRRRSRLGVGDRELCTRRQCQCDMPIPAGPAAHLMLVQPHFPFGRLKVLFDGPPTRRALHHLRRANAHRHIDHVVSQFCGRADTGADQQPAPPTGINWTYQGLKRPVVEVGSPSAVSRTQPLPVLT
jgi:hypothetical protein